MKFSLAATSEKNYIQSYSVDAIVVESNNNLELFQLGSNLIVSPYRIIFDKLIGSGQNLTDGDLFILKNLGTEILIFETKVSDKSIVPKLELALNSSAIGIEYMSLGAACRTYNLLLTEDRPVALVVNFL